MADTSPKRPLRVLYTINGSPQYILARSAFQVPITVLPLSPHDREPSTSSQTQRPRFATASLKTCLDTICRSSPELIQNQALDHSVYVLDPLESNTTLSTVNFSHSEQSRGVAVGLGLMSWALMTDESEATAVTGTLIQPGTGQEALEVIFSLREVCAGI